MANWYTVVSREYSYIEPVTMYGEGPVEYARYFVYAKAKTAKRAKVIALRYFRRQYSRFSWDMGEAFENPFKGMKAERLTEEEMEYAQA